MKQHKYIVHLHPGGQLEIQPFEATIRHDIAAKGRDVVSAGFCSFEYRRCYGESTTLNIGADEERDSALLCAYLDGHREVAA